MAITMQTLKAPLASLVDMTRFIGVATQACAVTAAGISAYLFVGLILRTHETRVFLEYTKTHLIRAKQ